MYYVSKTIFFLPVIQQHRSQSNDHRTYFKSKSRSYQPITESIVFVAIVYGFGPIKNSQKGQIFSNNNSVEYGGSVPRFSFF